MEKPKGYSQKNIRKRDIQLKVDLSGAVHHQNSFINIIGLLNCTVCKISIVLLILTSFVVVKPQKIQNKLPTYPKDTTLVMQPDSLILVGINFSVSKKS